MRKMNGERQKQPEIDREQPDFVRMPVECDEMIGESKQRL
jgi:hypothetical protein